ncbi:hypothetical protein ATSB10_01900 [Dyella thiooxydans]|uniref:Uncharacterized protein n=1 Tax=Dyella thiooxydans TaxID=445710 RepID=A0A160MXE4_9GAMM|nr:hypothetical protein ATSB10_01900 [Dyella thiooxydans]
MRDRLRQPESPDPPALGAPGGRRRLNRPARRRSNLSHKPV